MPEKTDVEWQALDDRIAQEVMGWFMWDDLPEQARKVYWGMVEEDPKDWDGYILAYNRERWWFLDEFGLPDWEYSIETSFVCSGAGGKFYLYNEWQPHESLPQMIEVRDRIASRGFDWCISRWAGAPQIQALFMRGWEHYEGYADTDAKALCLAIEKFMEENC